MEAVLLGPHSHHGQKGRWDHVSTVGAGHMCGTLTTLWSDTDTHTGGSSCPLRSSGAGRRGSRAACSSSSER